MANLLFHLRLAIRKKNHDQAGKLAHLIAYEKNISHVQFMEFIGQILLEDKYPAGLCYLEEVNQTINDLKRNVRRDEKQVRFVAGSKRNFLNGPQEYVNFAMAVAKLETNSTPFKTAFKDAYALLQNRKRAFCPDLQETKDTLDFNGRIRAVENALKPQGVTITNLKTSVERWEMSKQQSLPLGPKPGKIPVAKTSVARQTLNQKYSSDTFYQKKDRVFEQEVDIAPFSNDHLLKAQWNKEMIDRVQVAVGHGKTQVPHIHNFQTSPQIALTLRREMANLEIILDTKKRKRDNEDQFEQLVEKLYGAEDETFTEYMTKFLIERVKRGLLDTFYVYKPLRAEQPSLLQQVRYEYRLLVAFPYIVELDDIAYESELLYLDQTKKSYIVQLVYPYERKYREFRTSGIQFPRSRKPIEQELTVKGYKHLYKFFRVSFPTITIPKTHLLDFTDEEEEPAEIDGVYRLKRFVNNVSYDDEGDLQQKFIYQEMIAKKSQLSLHEKDVTDQTAVAIFKVLTYRWLKGIPTAKSDIMVLDGKVYSLNEHGYGKSQPRNNKHPDVWHQLFKHHKHTPSRQKKTGGKQYGYYNTIINKLQDAFHKYHAAIGDAMKSMDELLVLNEGDYRWQTDRLKLLELYGRIAYNNKRSLFHQIAEQQLKSNRPENISDYPKQYTAGQRAV